MNSIGCCWPLGPQHPSSLAAAKNFRTWAKVHAGAEEADRACAGVAARP